MFNPRGIFYALDLRDGSIDLGSVADRDSDPFGFLGRLWQISTSCSCVGFKMTRGQAENVLAKVIRDSEIKKLMLGRRNRIKTLVSELIAELTDQWELYCPTEKMNLPRIRVDFDQLQSHAAENKAFYDAIRRSIESENQPYIELEYETLNLRQEHKRILDFLEVRDTERRLMPASVKQTPTDLRSIISNFSELDSILSGTEFHHELHDLSY